VRNFTESECLFALHALSAFTYAQDSGVVTVEVTDTKHSVYIFGCSDATIDVKGKCKSVCIDGCKKAKVLVDDCISSVELVNCQRMQVRSACVSAAMTLISSI
jgi:Adenylate cyclase associated (CAP) C terminal